MTHPELEEIEKLAKECPNKGPWSSPWLPGSKQKCAGVQSEDYYVFLNRDSDGLHHPDTIKRWKQEAAYIAQMSPSTVGRMVKRIRDLEEALGWVINDVQEWCDAVEGDASWDSWDSHYKSFAYGGLDKARAALAVSGEDVGK